MNFTLAKNASIDRVETFLKNNQNIDKQSLLKTGYVVERNEEVVGCFILESVEEGLYWLKQLYIIRSESQSLPVLVEAILVLAKQQQAKQVYVNSHQPVVDILLEALQFRPQKNSIHMDKFHLSKGKWWSYNVS